RKNKKYMKKALTNSKEKFKSKVKTNEIQNRPVV
ncbi:unnamed protein product, partial [marine sediment metagenome]